MDLNGMSKNKVILMLIILAVLTRWLPHPPNVAPITGIALFGGSRFDNKWIGFGLPLLCMFISDLFLGFSSITMFVYLSFMLISYIGITSKKDSLLYKNADVNFLLPSVKEAGPGNFVPTSSTTVQIALGDAIAITCMNYKKFGKLDFKKFHPSGSLSIKLKTVEDLMLTGRHIPFISENVKMKTALQKIEKKGLGALVVKGRNNNTSGILTDGDLKRLSNLKLNFHNLKIKNVMKRKPISIDKDMLAVQALSIMNTKKITSLCVHQKNKKNKTIGFIHIHTILNANIS